jgi:hypothetical protein
MDIQNIDDLRNYARDNLIGVAHLRVMLGVGRERVYAISIRRGFPEPVYAKGNVRLWHRPDVMAWLSQNRGKGRDKKRGDG